MTFQQAAGLLSSASYLSWVRSITWLTPESHTSLLCLRDYKEAENLELCLSDGTHSLVYMRKDISSP